MLGDALSARQFCFFFFFHALVSWRRCPELTCTPALPPSRHRVSCLAQSGQLSSRKSILKKKTDYHRSSHQVPDLASLDFVFSVKETPGALTSP